MSRANIGVRGAARAFLIVWIALLSFSALAHVGSPDVFYDGMIGTYPARITIRMPNVVPGRAEISVRVQSGEPVEISFLPLYSQIAVSNAPPPDLARLVTGETNLYAGELWLMSFGAYSVEVRIKGEAGEGMAQIPVTSVALRQLPLPFLLGKILLLLAALLVIGGIGIAAAAGREATLPASTASSSRNRRNGYISASAAALVSIAALVGGKFWWRIEERAFRQHLLAGPWPDLAADVRISGSERILRLQVGKTFFEENNKFSLIPDHGKMMHLFLVREPSRDAFAHLHPIRKQGYTFEVALPPLPEGRYALFCDLTFEGGVSSTATNSIVLGPGSGSTEAAVAGPQRDPDDSWASYAGETIPAPDSAAPVYRFPDGIQITWKCQKPLRLKQDASLKFEAIDSSGQPVALEPYMGMFCHAAVLREDGSVFAHLHPAGNFSMAAQSFFETKLLSEAGSPSSDPAGTPGMDHMMHHHHSGPAVSSVYLPYEFPEPGNYRVWVQLKTGGRILTGVFDANVKL
jgi:hypothetical protein